MYYYTMSAAMVASEGGFLFIDICNMNDSGASEIFLELSNRLISFLSSEGALSCCILDSFELS